MIFSEFLELINSTAHSKNNNISAYLEYSSLSEYFPELEKDILEPLFAQGLLQRKHLNIWLSDGNTLGRLHFDPFDNLLCQVIIHFIVFFAFVLLLTQVQRIQPH